jgi:uncharacterized oligopeptide transporter (OPT) family protein
MSEPIEHAGTTPLDIDAGGDSRDDTAGRAPGGPRRRYREVTLTALLLAVVIGVVMNASITYAGLKIGFTIGGSAIAAVVGFGLLRGLLRPFVRGAGSVLEVNIAQTVASSVNTSNSGVIFTVPVLFLLGISLTWSDTDFWLITAACVAGGILGCAFIIPLRKQMIEIDRLRFPSAVGVAAILKSPGGGVKKTIVLVGGILLSALLYAPTAMHTLPFGRVDGGAIHGDTQRPIAELLTAREAGAGLDRLDELVLDERLTPKDAQTARDINLWVLAKEVPEGVAERGGLLADRRGLNRELAEAKKALEKAPVPAGTRENIADLKGKIASIDELLKGETISPLAKYPDELCVAAFKVSRGFAGEGEELLTWDDLRDPRYGWAADPLWGYHDLQARLPDYGSLTELGKLDPRVDRDQNGLPDLIITDEKVNAGRLLGLPAEIELIFAIAPFALGAGFITGRAGLLVLAGGILAYFVINPVVFSQGWLPATVEAAEAPTAAYKAFNRPLGIGLLLGGALMGVVVSLPAIVAALKSIASAGRSATRGGRDEMGLVPLIVAVVAAGGLLFAAADYVGNEPLNKGGLCPVTGLEVSAEASPSAYEGYAIAFADGEAKRVWDEGGVWGEGETAVTWDDAAKDAYLAGRSAKPGLLASLGPHARAGVIAVVGVMWIWFAGIIIAQCTGMTDWSPISGMALLTVVLVLLLAGSGAVMGAVLIGAALCVAITLAADMMADLKTGHLVGAKPLRQQICEMVAVPIGPVVTMLTILIIVGANMKTAGVPMGEGTTTTAPQAQALQAIIEGVQGGEMPYALYGLGAGLGVLLGLGSFAGLGVLVGLSMYLPFMYIATYGIGCVANILLRAFKGPRWAEEWGVPFAAGLIVGESILALVFNIIVLAMG